MQIRIGERFELSASRDFLLRAFGRELYWSRETGWTLERV